MDSIDALGPRPDRHAAFTGKLLSEAEDEELKAIVEEAARDLSTPIALVNLVLEQIQFFKAHHGLPPDLVAARGTDRDVSFCQFVVREGEPFEVVDAELDERVPKHLVKHYGIRSYLGMPIVANDTIVGSLCVIDTKPRAFSEEDRQNLKKLASLVNTRLAALAEQRLRPRSALKERTVGPALAELHKALGPIPEEALAGRIATTAIDAFLRLVDYALGNEGIHPAVIEQTLKAAREALGNCRDRLYDIEVSTDYARSSLSVLENVLKLSSSTQLMDIVQSAVEVMEPAVTPVGGTMIGGNAPEVYLSAPRALSVSILSTSLSLLAAQMRRHGLSGGIDIDVHSQDNHAGVGLRAKGLPEEALREVSDSLGRHLGQNPAVKTQLVDGALQLSFLAGPEHDQ